jgi:uncharacterized protein (TIGR02391 family)
VKLVSVAFAPTRTISRAAQAALARDQLDQCLSPVELKVTAEGRVARARAARTDTEALGRGERLKTLLCQRNCHEEVLKHCRPELSKSDYYQVAFEAVKGLSTRLKTMAGVDADGYRAVDAALSGASPKVRLTPLETTTERGEQIGIANLAKGLFSAVRTPAAHETRLDWTMTEQDALDMLGTISLIHRRLDGATTAS